MAAGPAEGRGDQEALRGDLRHQRICRGYRPARGARPGPEAARGRRGAPHRLPRPGPEHGPEGGRDAVPHPGGGPRGHRALLRPRRLLGRAQGELRGRAQGGPARGPPGPGVRQAPDRLGMPARGDPYPAGRGEAGRAHPGPRPASHRDPRPRLRSLSMARKIAAADILPPEEYARRRKELRREVIELKRRRRMEVGPVATLHFECFETMRLQIQEMLHIEKGGAAQLDGELAAYNPLVPDGRELVATVLFEIDDPERRARFLARLGGIEETAFIEMGPEKIRGRPEADQDRSTAEGKASSVQFIHFPFTPAQVERFRRPGERIVVGFEHPAYAHMGVMPEAVREALAGDFD